ncbi:hypothetical protein D0856_04690 [Vibrio owensii]|uniref:hypothetical protein n=1 Tax=Vibrio owensii TaxID=696485 RepID=UPI000EFA7B25|nr:hypothetical protein [Vibrio owensii]AYO19500.1 hypothetical protein D0856_04690 [Vibrio owensii]
MITGYKQIISDIQILLDFLNSLGIDASLKSHLENDYLEATTYVENYEAGKHNLLTDQGRSALGGLHELYKWLWSIKDNESFNILVPHLQMMAESAIRINSKTPMINPVTGKQDDSTNKLIETIVAMFAIKVGSEIDLDDPVSSSGGENPDIIFTYCEDRIAIACKTLRGTSSSTLLDNFRSAAKQIERADCDYGYVAINAMNILPHQKIQSNVYTDLSIPFHIVTEDMAELLESLKVDAKEELVEIFGNPKVRPVILTFIHSNTRLSSPIGNLSTMLKSTFATELIPNIHNGRDMEFLSLVNEFIHNRL